MQDITLTASPNLIIKDPTGVYTREQLARAVAYWCEIINSIDDPRPVGVCFGASATSFQSVALLLALISTARDYYKFDQQGPVAPEYSQRFKFPREFPNGLSSIFITGTARSNFDYSGCEGVYITDELPHSVQSVNHEQIHDLNITFRFGHSKYNKTSGTTGMPKFIKTNVGHDGVSVQCAINNYFQPDDYCVFMHNMSHIGVHSTAILPAVFGASVLSLVEGSEWANEIRQATHTQFFYTMMSYAALPPNSNLRVVTTGGDILKKKLVDHVLSEKRSQSLLDIYGLTEASPPLAIRTLRSVGDMKNPFEWVNHDYECSIDQDGKVVLTLPDRSVYCANDLGTYDSETKQFQYLGRSGIDRLRMQGTLIDALEFRRRFESSTGIVNYFIDFADRTEFPALYVTHQDVDTVKNYIREHDVPIRVVGTSELPTNGGIKNTRA
jgi:hypothetical protein